MKKIIFIGAPGSGKGTAANQITKEFNLDIISTGDIFRKIETENTPIAKQVQTLINNGELIPDEITNELVKEEISNHLKNHKGFILDGYPRSIAQAEFLNTICDIDHVIYFEIDKNLLLKRITGRLICNQCKKIYNTYFNPPKVDNLCDDCHTVLFKRKDDNEQTFNNRINQFESKTLPILNFYKNLNKLDTINASDSFESVVKEITKIIK